MPSKSMACTDLDKAAPAAGDDRHLHEECGVFGVYSNVTADVASLAYYALYALQHRGQESAGIVVNDDGLFRSWRDVGLVSDVFPKERLRSLGLGNIAVGHVRYGTTGSDNKRNVQPILVNHYKGRMALAHNGNLTNSQELRLQLESQGSIFHTTTDSEVIAYIIVQERLKHSSIEEAVSAAMDRLVGAYSLVISSPSKLIAVRDPHGFRPLCMGRLEDGSVVSPLKAADWTPWAPALSGIFCPERSWWRTKTASSPTDPTAASRPGDCAFLSSSTLPAPTP